MHSRHQISQALAELDPARKEYYAEMIDRLRRRKRALRDGMYDNPDHEQLHEAVMGVLCDALSPVEVDNMLVNLLAEMSAIMNPPRSVTAGCTMQEYVEMRSGQLAEQITTTYVEFCDQLGVDQ